MKKITYVCGLFVFLHNTYYYYYQDFYYSYKIINIVKKCLKIIQTLDWDYTLSKILKNVAIELQPSILKNYF